MKNRLKNIAVSVSFLLVLSGFMLANIFLPDGDLSYLEHRLLRSRPEFSWDKLFDGKLFLEFEDYASDQFALRDQFRTLKAVARYHLLGQRENNTVYLVHDGIYKLEYPLNEQAIVYAAAKFNKLRDTYLQDMNVYYAVIPDKNYYVAEANGYLAMDYQRMLDILHANVQGMNYVDLFDTLTAADYYRTDPHWRQDKIIPVAEKLLAAMGRKYQAPDYEKKELQAFYGAYYGWCGLPLAPDTITYLTSPALESARVYDHQSGAYGQVYNLELFASLTPYNFFLQGPKSVITIENPTSSQDRELIVFRDSFASSLAPLLLEGYAKVTLVDLRYISSTLLEDYIDFTPHQDVLFLYSIPVLNNSSMLK